MQAGVALSFMPRDFLVPDLDRDVTLYAAAHSSVAPLKVFGSAAWNGRSVFDRRPLPLTRDVFARFPVDAHALTVESGALGVRGSLELTVRTLNALTAESTDTAEVEFFPSPQLTSTVSTDAELLAALKSAKGSGVDHYRIQLSTGTYTFPAASDPTFAQWDLSSSGVLVTFEPVAGADVVVADSLFYLDWAQWKNITFRGTQATLVTVPRRSRFVFLDCWFDLRS